MGWEELEYDSPSLEALMPPNPPLTLRLVTWNCAMALRKKWDQLADLQPDVAVIQECEVPDKWPQGHCTSILWHGDNRHKGLAILTFGAWRLQPLAQLDASIEYVLPANVLGPHPFRILGVWTKPSILRDRGYVGQMLHAAQVYGPWLAGSTSVVVGDWNSNAQWDKPHLARHAATVALLAEFGLASAYHHHFRRAHGHEPHSTWYNHKRPEHGYPLDYCFVPQAWTPHLRRVHVGRPDQWLPYSDHCPVVVDVIVFRQRRGPIMEAKKAPPATIDEYIAQFPEDVQEVLSKIRAVIREAAPDASEKISYQMPTFYLRGNLVHFAAHPRHIGFYPTPSAIDAFQAELSAYNRSKGAVQFPLDQPMPYELISRIVEFRVAENRKKA